MTNPFVRSVKATGIFGRLDINLNFEPDINIIHAPNGAGKTTLLHILTNALNQDFERFTYLVFDNIFIQMSDGKDIEIKTEGYGKQKNLTVIIDEELIIDNTPFEKVRKQENSDEFVPPPSNNNIANYFPAFRTMIEAWMNLLDDRVRRPRTIDEAEFYAKQRAFRRYDVTEYARKVFGNFVPEITYPSPIQITQRLNDEINYQMLSLGRNDRTLLTEVFVNVLDSISTNSSEHENEKPQEILEQIKEMLDENQQPFVSLPEFYENLKQVTNKFDISDKNSSALTSILNVYKKAIYKRSNEQKKAFSSIELYLSSVNSFLENKEIIISRSDSRPRGEPVISLKFNDRTISGLTALSSGERQIATLMYATTRMSEESVILIDEPEISLHIDWQRILLKKMADQLGNRQIIVCTHSPSIVSDFRDKMVQLIPNYTTIDKSTNDNSDEIDVTPLG